MRLFSPPVLGMVGPKWKESRQAQAPIPTEDAAWTMDSQMSPAMRIPSRCRASWARSSGTPGQQDFLEAWGRWNGPGPLSYFVRSKSVFGDRLEQVGPKDDQGGAASLVIHPKERRAPAPVESGPKSAQPDPTEGMFIDIRETHRW